MMLTIYDTLFGLKYIGLPNKERLIKNKFYFTTPFFRKYEHSSARNYVSKTIPGGRTSKISQAGLEVRIKNNLKKISTRRTNEVNESQINRAFKRKFSK